MSTAHRRTRLLVEMGIGPVWRGRQPAAVVPANAIAASAQPSVSQAVPLQTATIAAPGMPVVPAITPSMQHTPEAIASMDWGQLEAAVAGCTACTLCRSRTKTVFGSGDHQAKWLFVGEGPGYYEDLEGSPFVGVSGKLLDNMLAAISLARHSNAFITNIVKCRPTDDEGKDRPPTLEEATACRPYLERQIALLKPEVIVALGKTAAFGLLDQNWSDAKSSLSDVRGKVHAHAAIPMVATYHPAYLLRRPAEKAKAWADLCLAARTHASCG